MARRTFSVVLFVKNEASRIAGALESVRWADEIVIVDDASTDDTPAICRSFGAKVITCEDSKGYFYKRRNFGFSQAASEWILMMDPDERVTPELREAILRVLEDDRGCDGFTFWRRNHFWGRPLRHGGWRQKTLHLFRKGRGGDRGLQVHSPIEVDGRVGHLDAPMDHFPFDSVAHFIEKQNFYTSFEAAEQAQRGWTDKALGRIMVLRPLKVFWKTYVKKRGFADGLPGFMLALLCSWIELLRWAKTWELAHGGYLAPAPSPEPAAPAVAAPPA
jgi:glycosyltransferase involved in cell wall biosynthesis